MAEWQIITPIQRAPYISGCRDTHILAENERGERFFVNRDWFAPEPPEDNSSHDQQ